MRAKALLIALAVTLACTAKDIKTVVLNTAPEMHCYSCENKIKSNIRFEKGVKDIVTNLADKTVTVTYDADKTDVDKIIEGFKKIDYVATIATPKAEGAPQAEQKKGGCCGSGGCKCGSAKKPEQAKAKPAKKPIFGSSRTPRAKSGDTTTKKEKSEGTASAAPRVSARRQRR